MAGNKKSLDVLNKVKPEIRQALIEKNSEKTVKKDNVKVEVVKKKLTTGYSTESGMSLQEANEKEFIINPDGSKDFGEITADIEVQSNGAIKVGKIRVVAGNTDYGLIHAKKHERQAIDNGYKSIEDFISDISTDFDKVYTSKTGENNYILVKTGDKNSNAINGVSPVFFELKSSGDNFYVVITAIPTGDRSLERNIKKETLIYSRPGLGSAATSNGSAVSKLDDNNVGVDNLIPTSDKSNVPN